jgi:pyruvate formate lyase activating enzyme
MKIGGLNKFSLSDFPRCVAAVIFTQGCNFRCPYCHNGSLIPLHGSADALIPEEALLEFLKARHDRLNAVVVSGGEPCIQPDLSAFLSQIKAMGFLVKLDTNGSKPEVLRKLVRNNLVDYIAMDIKAPLYIYDHLCGVHAPISRIKESVNLISQAGVEHEFRTTVVEPLLSPADIRSILKLVPAGSKHRLQEFRPEHALAPALRACENRHSGDSTL